MDPQFVSYSCINRVGTIQINRAEKRNALNSIIIDQLKSSFKEAASDKNCKVIVLKSTGTVFSAGADLEYLSKILDNGDGENLADSMHLMELFNIIYNFPISTRTLYHILTSGFRIYPWNHPRL